jgi:RNA polymerase sigma-70 factor (ECF subfamily)
MFDAVWRIVRGSLVRLSDPDREDLTQEVVIRVWLNRRRYQSERGSPEQWIRTIAKRMAINFGEKRGFVLDDLPETVASTAPDPEETLKWSQLARLADQVLAKLPVDERRVLILREIERHTFATIAEMLNISQSTAHARYTRGMDKLKKAKEDGTLGAILVPIVPEDDPPTPEMRDRAWQRFVDSGALDLPPDSEPPPSGTRRTGRLTKLRKLGPLVAIFLGPGLPAPRSEPPAVAFVSQATAPAAPASIATEPITTATVVTVHKPTTRTTPPRRPRPPGQVQPEHGGADARDRFKTEASILGETASR